MRQGEPKVRSSATGRVATATMAATDPSTPPATEAQAGRYPTAPGTATPPSTPPAVEAQAARNPATASPRSPRTRPPALDTTPGPAPRTPRAPVLGADGQPWWESYFGPDHGLLSPDKDAASGEAEARSIVAALALRPQARVLDVGCGAGRHALALARRGFAVTGVDLSSHLLDAAAAAREEAGLALDLRLHDMRQLPLEGAAPFDAVLSMYTSFGYFTDAENELVARGLAASLAPGGRLLLDLNNREALEKASGTRTWSERPGGYLLDELAYDPDARRFHGTRVLLGAAGERRYPFDHRAYTESEIRALLRKAGLRVIATCGSLERTPFNARAPRMVILAER